MSKTSLKNKELKAKKAAKKVTKQPKKEPVAEAAPAPNAKCCMCSRFSNHPGFCSVLKAYRARKADICESFKSK